jgi:anti-anti-sigma factor
MVVITTEDHGKVIIMNIEGEFYIDSLENAEQAWNLVLEKKPKVVALNCKSIKYIDSSAIGILVKFLNSALKQKAEMIFYDLNDSIMTVFRTAKLNNFFKIMSKTQFEMEYLEKQ